MGIPDYVRVMRAHIGHDLLLLPGVSAIVVDEHGRLLLARRSDTGRWAILAGMVEPGEQPADTIVREVREEAGVDVVIERILGVATHPVHYPNGDRCEYLNVSFLCRAVGGTARVNDDESLEVAWFEPADLPELEPYSQLRVDLALRDAKEAWFAPVGSRHPALVDPSMGPADRRTGGARAARARARSVLRRPARRRGLRVAGRRVRVRWSADRG